MQFLQLLYRLIVYGKSAFFLDRVADDPVWAKLISSLVKKWMERSPDRMFYAGFTRSCDGGNGGAAVFLLDELKACGDAYTLNTYVRNMNLYGFQTTVVKELDKAYVISVHKDPLFNSGNPLRVFEIPRQKTKRRSAKMPVHKGGVQKAKQRILDTHIIIPPDFVLKI